MIDPTTVRAVLLDIEGTTTPISFVYDVLFPYAERNVELYLRAHFNEDGLRTDIETLKAQRNADENDGMGVPPWSESSEQEGINSVTDYVKWLISRDSKVGALKALQGKIWEEGYATGQLIGQIFDDVPHALRRWRAHNKLTYIYSSGSVLAQKLLFSHSNHGDLTAFLDGFFDTSVGAKSDPRSYRRIAESLGLDTGTVLFVSDALKELDCAESAGMQTMLSIRPGNPPVNTAGRAMIRSFDELPF
jgi:enolase-phosphatase E1